MGGWGGKTVYDGNKDPMARKYWEQHPRDRKFGGSVCNVHSVWGKYSFQCPLTGRTLPSTSKYMPRQGEQEIARRLRKQRSL